MSLRGLEADKIHMRFSGRKIIGLAVISLVAALLHATPSAAAGSCWSVRPAENGFATKMNASRSAASLGSLRMDPELSRVARKHTREMVERKTLHHTSFSTLGRRVTNWVTLGENVGVGNTVDSLHRAFMNSPTHRGNILHAAYRHVGVGTIKKNGRLWVTVVFEAQTDPGTTLRMPSC